MNLYALNNLCRRILFKAWPCRLLASALFLVGALVLVGVHSAEARLSGELAWSYKDYKATEDDQTVREADHFTQKYSIVWQKSGLFKGGRGGRYNLGLGYEWLAAQGTDNDDHTDVTADKILYNGDFTFAPGALPFRLHAFAHDKTSSLIREYQLNNTILEPRFALGLGAGENRQVGLTFMIGIKNGSYLGRYRQILSKYPRVFFDYKEQTVRDDSGIDKQDYVMRDLAFVSLNKKDNWFHYRFKEFRDHRDGRNDLSEKAFVLGTIDHTLTRQWIHLTNWIQISTDFSFTEQSEGWREKGRQTTDTYALNFFSLMSRDHFKVRNFSHFTRIFDSYELEQNRLIPVYADGQINPDMGWRGTFINYSEETTYDSDTGLNFLDEGTYAAGQLNMRRRAQLSFDAKLDAEHRQTQTSTGSALRLRLEAFSNARYQRKDNYFIGYTFTYQNGKDRENDVNYFEQIVSGNYEKQMTRQHTLRLDQSFLYGSGDPGANLMSYIGIEGSDGMRYSSQEHEGEGSLFRSTSSLSLMSTLTPRLTNVASAYLEWLDNQTGQLWQASLEQSLRYRGNQARFDMKNYLLLGDDLNKVAVSENLNDPVNTKLFDLEANYVLGHESRWTYQPNQYFESDLRLDFNLTSLDNDDIYATEITLRNSYAFYTNKGRIRQIASLYNEVSYTGTKTDNWDRYTTKFLLGGSYNPYRILRLGAEIEHERFRPEGVDLYRVRTMAELIFPKLQCELSYAYGTAQAEESALVADRKEHLIEAEVKKQF